MSEHTVPVKVERVYLLCDECGYEMTYMGVELLSHPPQYPHRCMNDHIENAKQRYPFNRFIALE